MSRAAANSSSSGPAKRAGTSQQIGTWVGVLLLLAVVGLNTGASLIAAKELIEKNRAVEHTRIVSSELDGTLAALLMVLNGERGYLYTGEPQYLEPFRTGKQELQKHLDRLTSLTADSPSQQGNVVRLRSRADDAVSFFENVIDLQAGGKPEAAKELVLTGGAKLKIDAVHEVLTEMSGTESLLLVSRSAAAKRSEGYLLFAIPIFHAFTAALLVTAGLLVSRDVRKQVEVAGRLRKLAERKHAALKELKATQDALVRAEKLVVVGRMAATVAHEINNPLEAVTNLIWISKNDPAATEGMRKRLQLADNELRRVAQIAKQTLGFYRGMSQQEVVEIREVMDGVLQLYASRLLGKQISVRTQFEDCYVFGNSGEFRQLFSNLFANAIDALPTQGMLAVKSSRFDLTGIPGVRVTIADNGCGIAAENFKSVFQPFFTTKTATGTGLGLWVAKQIAEKHQGSIAIRSSALPQRHYTAISVFLPAHLLAGDHVSAIAS